MVEAVKLKELAPEEVKVLKMVSLMVETTLQLKEVVRLSWQMLDYSPWGITPTETTLPRDP